MKPEEIDAGFVPLPVEHVESVALGDETILLDGWNAAMVLNPSAASIWDLFDGERSLDGVAAHLSEATDTDADQVVEEVISFTRSVGAIGLLRGVEAAEEDHGFFLVSQPGISVGDTFEEVPLVDLDGSVHSLSEYAPALVLNWNPHCGYCGSIADRLADLQDPLTQAGLTLVLVVFGDRDANREFVDRAGITAPILLLEDHESPFGPVGTPSAVHLDADLRVASEPAFGNIDVPRLAAELAGLDPELDRSRSGDIRYLLEEDGLCAPGAGDLETRWAATRVYRIGDHHVGIRVDNDQSARTLDALFEHRVVDDPRAGHSYSLTLPGLVDDGWSDSPTEGLNLLHQSTRPAVRSRDPERILRALLSDLDDRINDGTARSGLRVDALAVQLGDCIGLIPSAFHAFAPRLQSLLARRGLAISDVPHPEIDLGSTEVVIPAPAVDHDASVLDTVGIGAVSGGELPTVLPGRYPLIGWCVTHPGDHRVLRLSPAQMAAATLSSTLDIGEPADRLRELADLFSRVPAFGLWYLSEAEMADGVARALGTG